MCWWSKDCVKWKCFLVEIRIILQLYIFYHIYRTLPVIYIESKQWPNPSLLIQEEKHVLNLCKHTHTHTLERHTSHTHTYIKLNLPFTLAHTNIYIYIHITIFIYEHITHSDIPLSQRSREHILHAIQLWRSWLYTPCKHKQNNSHRNISCETYKHSHALTHDIQNSSKIYVS